MNNTFLSRGVCVFILSVLFYLPALVFATTQVPKMPQADYYALASKSANVSPSLWNQYEKGIYQNILKNIEADILVVPAQVQQYALDKIALDLMTFSFVDYLQQITTKRIVDPSLVSRALGEGNRTYNADDVYRLAAAMKVKQIIWLYVGHEQKMAFNLTVQVQNKTGDNSISRTTSRISKNWLEKSFLDTSPPYETFKQLIPEIAEFAGFEGKPLASTTEYPEYNSDSIAIDPKLFAKASLSDPMEQAFTYQVLATLTPSSQMRLREELFAKSLIALSKVSSQTPDFALLKARAY
ncbi:MAG: hypothetical protein R3240_10090, partial [Gammaproteobacteria bacterium]|nr:hypothetical protein [Gammaproteobacteria bacterium]